MIEIQQKREKAKESSLLWPTNDTRAIRNQQTRRKNQITLLREIVQLFLFWDQQQQNHTDFDGLQQQFIHTDCDGTGSDLGLNNNLGQTIEQQFIHTNCDGKEGEGNNFWNKNWFFLFYFRGIHGEPKAS